MLHRKLEHCGVKKYDSLDSKNSRAQSVMPGSLAAAEDFVECIAIICCDTVRYGRSSQSPKYVLVVDANVQEAVVDEFGWLF